ncbi:Gfo/Idh/MocA family oxidoreductase [Micrococcales bacterium 31B]|nr:Gfo/Idh/MocA family oxidoreductase [Micrococcales bacterium 31B]
MTTALRIATLSFWHVHAGDYSRDTLNHPGTELVAVWDDDQARGEAGAKEFGAEYTNDLDGLLAREDLDGVIITTETRLHTEVMLKAIAAGKHVFTEKILAPTVAECEQIIAAARAKGVALTVSLPRLYDAYTQVIKGILEAGSLGDISYSRVRLAHAGSTFGWLPDRFYDATDAIGGALTDLGCHPVYLTQLILGLEPQRVSATYSDFSGVGVDDNSVVTAQYASGAIGVIEAGFVHSNSPFSIEVYGTSGGVRYSEDQDFVWLQTGEGTQQLPLGDRLPTAYEQWVTSIHDGTLPEDNLERATHLTRLVVAANAAAASGSQVDY